jgi:4-amino-4-deoxy-L-arabinose transferase-like glycosyltransferase
MRFLGRQRALPVFIVGVLVLAGALTVVVSRRSWHRIGFDGVPVQLVVGQLPAGTVGCQPREPLVAGTHAVQIHALPAGPGSVSIRVQLRGVGRYAGVGPAGTAAPGGTVVAALAHPTRTALAAQLCIWNTGRTGLLLQGVATGTADQLTVSTDGKQQTNMVGRVRIEDLSDAHPTSLWATLDRLPERIATATGSALAPWLVVAGFLIALAAAAVLLYDPAGRAGGVKRDVLVSFLLACAIGAGWAGITPAFEKTDETAHFAYVQAFAELGHPPTEFTDTGLLSNQLACWYNGLGILHYRFFTEERPPWLAQTRRSLDRSCAGLSPRYNGAMYMAFQPPAYYALAAGAYDLGDGLALPTRLLFARLVSVLLAAIAIAMTYLLARELIPGSPWPARGAALALALQPVFMFNESGINPDALMVAVASAIALVGAYAWRRGLTTRRALALGALTGLGVISKTNFLALLPSILLLTGALWWGGGHTGRSLRLKRLIAGATLAGLIFGLYALINDVAWHRGLRYTDASYGGPGGSLRRLLSFAWQFFLPRLPDMHNLVGGTSIPFVNLIESSTTRLGWWNDYGIASGWTPVIMALGIVLATGAVCYLAPRAKRRPAPLLVTLGCAVLFLAALVWSGYQFSLGNGVDVIIPRHALPVMSLWGLLVGAAIAAVRPRWRPAATGLIAALLLAHTVIAITTTTSRFYL